MRTLSLLALSYLLGSIPFGLMISKWWARVDVRQFGSGNIGVTNVLRTTGFIPAFLTLLGDSGKGLLAVLLTAKLIGSSSLSLLAGVFAVIGHNWPLFLGFKGGKGVATAAGAVLAFRPWALLILATIWLLVLLRYRYVSLSSIVVCAGLPVVLLFFKIEWQQFALALLLAALTVFRHRSNIERLRSGTEYRFGEKTS